jgi:hypothetical protein
VGTIKLGFASKIFDMIFHMKKWVAHFETVEGTGSRDIWAVLMDGITRFYWVAKLAFVI